MTAVRLNQPSSIVIAVAAAIIAGGPGALAQTSVKDIFEKHKLIGTFAWDCSKPAANTNLYFVHRAIDGGYVQRDQMTGETKRDWTALLEKATEAGPNQIAFSGTVTGRIEGRDYENAPVNGSYQIEPNRIRQWEAMLDGRKTIAGGKILNGGYEVPWANRCGG
jgi:hypothetical protein